MKLIEAVLFLFYDYYRKRMWERAPVFHASASLSLLIWMNVVSIACLAGKCELVFSSKETALLTLAISLGIIFLLAKHSNFRHMQMSKRRKELGVRILVSYIIISIAVLFYSFFYSSSTEPTIITPIR
jgi:hypothetical protein